MSKYKYSSLLSSQYRKVFKSYHSLDRHEQQLKQNMSRSLRKPLQTRYTAVNSHNNQYSESREYLNYPPFHISKPQPYLYYKTTEQYRNKMEATRQSLKHLRTGLKRQRQQTLPSSVVVTESRPERLRTQLSEYQRQYDNGNINQSNEHKQINELRNKDLIRSMDNRFERMCFKNQLSQKREYDVNRKKNDKKLIMRVNDVEKIRKKYNYIEKDSNFCEISESHAKDLKKENNKYHNKSRNPLGQVNFNNISSTHNRKQSQEQSVRTPHFHQTSTKHNSHPQASQISKKLQSLVKNTFTDRFQ